MYIAHIRESDKEIQTVEEHLLGVKQLAASYGESVGLKYLCGLAGLLHDLGKYTDEFKKYILQAVYHPEAPPKRGSVDHSTAGAKLLYDLYHTPKTKEDAYLAIVAEIVGNAILSHHSYLQDFLSPSLELPYLTRVKDKYIKEYQTSTGLFFEHVLPEKDFQEYVKNAGNEMKQIMLNTPREQLEKTLLYITKFVFSALIDADRTNTRLYEEGITKVENPTKTDELFINYYERLMGKIVSFQQRTKPTTPINKLRQEMSDQCEDFARRPSGIYSLSIPTGGGKTLASLRYALKHALIHKKRRIIYVIPFTTIIEQNTEEVRKIINDDGNILEHHSNVLEDYDEFEESDDGSITVSQKLKLAKDNWDSPIIFTTMVQFLNVFYARGNRNTRRLHNLSESIIIFDEVQKVPSSCVALFNEAVNFLKRQAKCSIVLCTATQPALEYVTHKLDTEQHGEMIRDLPTVTQAFKRVRVVDFASEQPPYDSEKLSEFVLEKIKENSNMLVILNTKAVVKKLYNLLKEQQTGVPVYHLSTSMCAAHRKKILKEIRTHLNNGTKLICISTQLIEAGVDVSFECVIRSLAGLDSIAQAAGRCNRHGEYGIREVYVIDHDEENLSRLKEIQKGKQITKRLLVDIKRNPLEHGGDLLSQQAMERYFKEFYSELASDLNYPVSQLRLNMTDLLFSSIPTNKFVPDYVQKYGMRPSLFIMNSYKTAADHFEVISNLSTSAIVPYDEKGKELITKLSGNFAIEELSNLLKEAQQYMVNLFSYELQQLDENSGIVSYMEGKVLVLTEGAYDEEFGLNVGNDSSLSFSYF